MLNGKNNYHKKIYDKYDVILYRNRKTYEQYKNTILMYNYQINYNIKSIRDIMNARAAIMHKCLDLPRSVRDTVLIKHQRLLDYVLLDSERDENRVEEGEL
jgi:hypothetical protein